MFGLGMTEILVIGGIVLVLFGGKKLPELGRGMGRALTNFKEGLKEGDHSKSDDQKNLHEENKHS